MHRPRIISSSLLSLPTDETDSTLGASGLWLGTRTETGGTATLTVFFIRRSWLYGQPTRLYIHCKGDAWSAERFCCPYYFLGRESFTEPFIHHFARSTIPYRTNISPPPILLSVVRVKNITF